MTQTRRSDVHGVDDLGWALGLLFRSYRERVAGAVGDFPHGARGYQTLCEVVKGDQPSQLALANHLGIDRTVMTYLVDDLVEAGFVRRQPNPKDRRQRLVVPTPRGQKAVADLCGHVGAAEAEVLGALDTDERTVLRGLLGKAVGGLSESHGTADPCDVVEDGLDP